MKNKNNIKEMTLWEKVVDYCYENDGNLMVNYLNDEDSFIEIIAFGFLSICYILYYYIFRCAIFPIIVLLTVPVWIIPYCIFYNKKIKKRK